MFKNVASQQVTVLAIDTATNTPKTGDGANITVYLSKDDGTVTALTDSTATEASSTNAKGLYRFDVSQSETNADKLVFSGKSTTSGVEIVPITIFTRPANASSLSIDSSGRVDAGKMSGTALTARDIGASVLLSSGTGTGQISLSSGAVLLQPTQTGVTIPTVTTVTNQLTAAQIATGVWQDTTAGDFTVTASIGKSLYTSGNAPGASSGLALVGSNMGTITGGTITTVSDKTGYSLSSSGLASVTTWTVGITGDITGSLSGSVGSVTGNVGGNVAGSVGSVSGAVGSVTGNVGGNVTGSVGSVVSTVTVGTNNDKTGYSLATAPPTANENAAALLDLTSGVETSLTVRQALRLVVAAEAGKISGAETTTIVIRNFGDSKDRITATVDSNGNRTAITADLT